MMNEDYVSFEVAKLLNTKGFKGEFHKHYWGYEPGKEFLTDSSFNPEYDYPAPTIQMAMKWLREEHNKSIEVRSQGLKVTSIGWIVEIYDLVNQQEEFHHPYTFPTYEEACEVAIKYCLEHLI